MDRYTPFHPHRSGERRSYRAGQDCASGGDPVDRIDLGSGAVSRNVVSQGLALVEESTVPCVNPRSRLKPGATAVAEPLTWGDRIVDLYRAIERMPGRRPAGIPRHREAGAPENRRIGAVAGAGSTTSSTATAAAPVREAPVWQQPSIFGV
jgi:hypothetical protein